jgi:hypothetical protein
MLGVMTQDLTLVSWSPTIDPAHAVAATGAELPDTPYIAAGLKLGGRLLVIPDLEALKQAFYP